MTVFRIYLIVSLVLVAGYTTFVVAAHGFDFAPVFFGDLTKMSWAGQFNADFLSFLALGGLWLAWRHHFSPGGIALGLLIFAGGMPFLASYLVFQSFRPGADARSLLLGERRAREP